MRFMLALLGVLALVAVGCKQPTKAPAKKETAKTEKTKTEKAKPDKPKKEEAKTETATAEPAKTEMKIEVKDSTATKVVYLEYVGNYAEIGKKFEELMKYAMENKLEMSGPPIGMYFDDPAKVPPDKTRAEVCVPVKGEPKVTEPYKVKEIPAGKVASTVMKGPYEEIAKSYGDIFKWIGENKFKVDGPLSEIYLNNPKTTKPQDLVTEVRIPISNTGPTPEPAAPAPAAPAAAPGK